jgi:hypothetical protein
MEFLRKWLARSRGERRWIVSVDVPCTCGATVTRSQPDTLQSDILSHFLAISAEIVVLDQHRRAQG